MRSVREAVFPIYWFHHVGFQEPVDEHGATKEECLFDIVDFALRDPTHNVWSGRKDVHSHSNVVTREGMVDGVVLCKWLMKQKAHGHLFRAKM